MDFLRTEPEFDRKRNSSHEKLRMDSRDEESRNKLVNSPMRSSNISVSRGIHAPLGEYSDREDNESQKIGTMALGAAAPRR